MYGSTSALLYTPADRSLERSMIFNFVIHGLALASMALLLMPALPGGSGATDLERVTVIAEHPWLFRLGWLPWQLCAVADLWMAVAMVRVTWLPRVGAWLVLVLTVCAVIPDQYAQTVWITQGVTAAQTDAAQYLALEKDIFPITSGWGALFYTLAALGWTWCFARAGTWSRALTWLSVPLWISMLIAVTSPLLPDAYRPSASFIATANGAGFLQLQLWLALVTEEVLRRFRPFAPHGRLARWRHPGSGLFPRIADLIANSRLIRALLEPLPPMRMRSDIRDVVYVNYLLPAEHLEPLIPQGLELQRLGPDGKYALFTFLTYEHGHFGVAFWEPLRKLFPSPVQTNWRIHVRDPATKREGIYFLTNAVTHLLQAFGARLLAEGMPMHRLEHGAVTRSSDGQIDIALEPGKGTAPDAQLVMRPCATTPELRGAWAECWPDFRAFLAYVVPQDRAMSTQPLKGRVVRQEIELGIPLEDCVPLEGTVTSRAAEEIAGDADAVCFGVDRVEFRFEGEWRE